MPRGHMSLTRNVVQRQCGGGVVEHAWLPPLQEGPYASRSAPYGLCCAFSRHKQCVVSIAGKTLHRDINAGGIWINGPEVIGWHLVREPSEVVEITAHPDVRRAIAEEMGI